MSRGPGVVQRAIEATFLASPSRTFMTEELVPIAYPGVNRVERKHRVAVIRAADIVAVRLGWQGWRIYRPGHSCVWINPFDVRSYALGRMRADFLDGRHSLAEIEKLLDTPGAHGSKHDLVQPGGAWWQHVEINKARRDGRSADADAMVDALRHSFASAAAKLVH